MTTTGLQVFDTTLHKTNEWLGDLMQDLHTDDRQQAYRVLRATLHALRDRLGVDEAAHLGAQLPMLVRGFYYEGWAPARTPTDHDLQGFLARIREEMSDRPGVPDPERWARAALGVLERHVDAGEIDEIVGILPDDLKTLWPAHAATS